MTTPPLPTPHLDFHVTFSLTHLRKPVDWPFDLRGELARLDGCVNASPWLDFPTRHLLLNVGMPHAETLALENFDLATVASDVWSSEVDLIIYSPPHPPAASRAPRAASFADSPLMTWLSPHVATVLDEFRAARGQAIARLPMFPDLAPNINLWNWTYGP